jgi:hypothetical protein
MPYSFVTKKLSLDLDSISGGRKYWKPVNYKQSWSVNSSDTLADNERHGLI